MPVPGRSPADSRSAAIPPERTPTAWCTRRDRSGSAAATVSCASTREPGSSCIATRRRRDMLVFADGAIWAGDPGERPHLEDRPRRRTAIVQQQKLHGWLSDLAVGGGSVWAPILPDGVVYKLSEDDLGVQTEPSRRGDPERCRSEADTSGWRTRRRKSCRSSTTSRVPAAAALRGAADYGAPTTQVSSGLRRRRAARRCRRSKERSSESRRRPIRPSTPTRWEGRDQSEQLMYATCANLLYYPDSAGSDGTRLRPEIAAAMPTVSPDGRTYTFRIRRGYPLLAAVRRGGHSRDVPAHARARTLAEERVLGRAAAGVGHRRRAAYRAGKAAHISGVRVRRQRARDHARQTCG